SRRRHTRLVSDWSSDVCSSDLVSKLTPIGVFAVVASAAGTMRLEDLSKLQVYLWTYMAIALVLTLWVLPALIMSCTTLTYRQVRSEERRVGEEGARRGWEGRCK